MMALTLTLRAAGEVLKGSYGLKTLAILIENRYTGLLTWIEITRGASFNTVVESTKSRRKEWIWTLFWQHLAH